MCLVHGLIMTALLYKMLAHNLHLRNVHARYSWSIKCNNTILASQMRKRYFITVARRERETDRQTETE